MHRTTLRKCSAAILILLAFLGIWVEADAAGARSGSAAKPSRPPISQHAESARGFRPEEINRNLGSGSHDPAKRESEARTHWEKVTQSLGAETADSNGAYVVLHTTANGKTWMTTNLIRGLGSDRTFTEFSASDLKDRTRLEAAFDKMLGDRDPSASVTLKVLAQGSLIDGTNLNRVSEALDMSTDRFRFAELIEVSTGRAYSLERVAREHGAPRWLSRLNKCCVYTGIPPDIGNWKRLSSVPFDRSRAQVVSLFPDLDSQRRLERSGLNVAISHPDQLAGDVQAELMKVFSDGPEGAPVIVIGHVNNGSFVIETASGSSITLSAISEMARLTSRPVYLLGCYTAEHYQQKEPSFGFPVTTLTVLYPRELIDRVGSAGRNSKNLQDFTALISSEDLYVQLPKDFLTNLPDRRSRLFAHIASVTQNGARAITGFFKVELPCLLAGR